MKKERREKREEKIAERRNRKGERRKKQKGRKGGRKEEAKRKNDRKTDEKGKEQYPVLTAEYSSYFPKNMRSDKKYSSNFPKILFYNERNHCGRTTKIMWSNYNSDRKKIIEQTENGF